MGAPWDVFVAVGAIVIGEVNPFGLQVGPKLVVAKIVRPPVIAAGFHCFLEAKRIVGRRRSRHLVVTLVSGRNFATQCFGSQ
jgi:hypothetical protein